MTRLWLSLLLAAAAGLLATTKAIPNNAFATYHAGPWEQQIGYSQAVRAGNVVYVSGTVGEANGRPADLDGQMKNAYREIEKTLAHYHANLSNVLVERIYTTDMQGLIASQNTRKSFYGSWLPAATWVEVKRLYEPSDKIEIEVEAIINPS